MILIWELGTWIEEKWVGDSFWLDVDWLKWEPMSWGGDILVEKGTLKVRVLLVGASVEE